MSSIETTGFANVKANYQAIEQTHLQLISFSLEGAQRAEEAVHLHNKRDWEPSMHLPAGLRTCLSSPVLVHPWGDSGALGLPPSLYQQEGGSLPDIQLKPLWLSMVPKTSHHQVWNKQANVLLTQTKFTIHLPLQWHEGRPHPPSQCQ